MTQSSILQVERLTEKHALGAAAMMLLAVASTHETWQDIYRFAVTNEEYSHIFLVPLVAAWLVLVRRGRFERCSPGGTIVGPIVALAGWLISMWGFYHQVISMWHGGALLVVIGCMLSVLGKSVLFRFLPAFVVLLFLIPIPGRIRIQIALPLQEWTAAISQKCFELLGVSTELAGNTLRINGAAPEIAEACNGMRMVFGLLMVAFAFAFGTPLRNSVRLLILALSPVVALACNVIRTLPTIYMYGYYRDVMVWTPVFWKDPYTPLPIVFHDAAGWAMLPIAFGILYGVLKLMRWALIPVSPYTLASQ